MIIDCFIGIDPGISNGGISIWRPNKKLEVIKMPREMMDLLPLFKELKKDCEHPLVFLEKVQTRPDDLQHFGKAINIQKMLASFEKLKTVMEFAEMPFVQVHPISWQSYLKLRKKKEGGKDRKNRYKTIAQELYPEVKATLWNSDSSLLVHFGRKKYLNDQNWIFEALPDKYHNLIS